MREDVSDNSVVLRYDGSEYTYPVIDSTVGDKGFDIGKLRAQTGLVTLDSGYGNTAAYKSAITYLDGEAGILRYRGYPIEQLAERSTFLEVAYLLINGELPTVDELAAFKDEITQHTLLHEDVKNFYRGFPRDAHPMAMLSSVVSALSTFYQDSHNPFDEQQRNLSTIRLLAKLPTIAAYAYKKSVGHPFVYPRNDLGYVENFLRMTFSVPAQEYDLDPVVVSALDKLLILHADHEQNCSTSTVRLVGSSQANMFASISAGINALWGPLHGGANQSVLEMLEGIRDSGGDVDSFIRKVKNKEDGVRLMGFGHRVYKNFDPRAKIIKAAAHDVLSALGKSDELLDIALKLEEHALSDDYFVSRSLYPNVDFYTGLIYRAMGFPTEMFTVLFALGRLPGWIAQWHEMIKEPGSRIGRPRQIYTGLSSGTSFLSSSADTCPVWVAPGAWSVVADGAWAAAGRLRLVAQFPAPLWASWSPRPFGAYTRPLQVNVQKEKAPWPPVPHGPTDQGAFPCPGADSPTGSGRALVRTAPESLVEYGGPESAALVGVRSAGTTHVGRAAQSFPGTCPGNAISGEVPKTSPDAR